VEFRVLTESVMRESEDLSGAIVKFWMQLWISWFLLERRTLRVGYLCTYNCGFFVEKHFGIILRGLWTCKL
jgi:hypothetical protein